jgi:hypothetical protein
MLGSQVLEVAIGLAVVFFILALAGSAVVELLSQILSKRSRDLRKAVGRIMAGQSSNLPRNPEAGSNEEAAKEFVEKLYDTSPIKSLVASAKRDPSYIAASAFGSGVMEYLGSGDLDEQIESLPDGLRSRVESAYATAENEVKKVQAELESWFDQSMDRLSGVYKRWARWVVLVSTIVIVLAVNADTVNIATELWESSILRQALIDASATVTDPSSGSAQSLSDVADELEKIEGLGIPLLWDCPDGCGGLSEWVARVQEEQPRRALGWIITILLVSLGAPFWYGALTKLTSLRSAGSKPPTADKDDTSATSLLLREEAAAAGSPTLTLDLAVPVQPEAPTQPVVPVPE